MNFDGCTPKERGDYKEGLGMNSNTEDPFSSFHTEEIENQKEENCWGAISCSNFTRMK